MQEYVSMQQRLKNDQWFLSDTSFNECKASSIGFLEADQSFITDLM